MDELRPGDEGFGGFRMRLPENCVEYMLFIIESGEAESCRLQTLEAVRKAATKTADELTQDYIWQREAFALETKVENGLVYLHGATDFGDNVEDEWLIVYLLRELSKSFSNLWIRVFDSDGEFLLIEAAKVLPKWLSPEMDSNRVWLHDGKLFIIPLGPEGTTSKSISVQDALYAVKSAPDTLVHSTFIEAEAFYRLEKYPGQIKDSLHHSLVTIPRKLAYILHARPKAIAPATEAFYLRDPVAMKPLLSPSSSLLFPPTDLVTISVRFTKVLYAQLKSQRFDPPPAAWKNLLQSAEVAATTAAASSTNKNKNKDDEDALVTQAQKTVTRLDMGMKVTSGFEILAKDAHESKNRITREVALMLDDLEEDGDSGSLPIDEDIEKWKDVQREDDDSWMDINFADLEQELGGGGGGQGTKNQSSGFGDAAAQADLQKIVSRFQAFLNDEDAGIGGAEMDEMDEDDDETDEEGSSDDDEDRQVSFDEEQFAKMMREMMGLPPTASDNQEDVANTSRLNANKQDESKDGGEEEQIQELMMQMEKELNEHGALALDPPGSSSAKKVDKRPILKSAEAGGGGGPSPDKGKGKDLDLNEDSDDEEGEEEVDIDYNLAKNLLESFKSQAGMAGPAGNLLSLMGMALPRDEDEDDGE
ncbi:SGT1 protein-domain-containing protein [Apodospora peruviana]|uniref:SGT1 protein-domain-containing protein n=1 Tax=Apodospora peruviana TaxID=516989 RepID=A0AAE0M7B3_9PEZI|nr:SGT1 protein-domain-containing protein [Apodospora peruviana]